MIRQSRRQLLQGSLAQGLTIPSSVLQQATEIIQ
jgi:hypothetical protein